MSEYPHRIRLRGPWEYELPGESPPSRATMPCHWRDLGLAPPCPALRWRRRFGYPGRIDAHERVWLTFADGWRRSAVQLNGAVLGRLDGTGEFDVTALLRERNDLLVEIENPGPDDTWGEVALEVRCAAHLADVTVRARREGTTISLEARGIIAGSSAGALELYMILDRGNVAYALARPGPFTLVATGLAPEVWQQRPADAAPRPIVRIDLVQGASIWYRWERETPLTEPEA